MRHALLAAVLALALPAHAYDYGYGPPPLPDPYVGPTFEDLYGHVSGWYVDPTNVVPLPFMLIDWNALPTVKVAGMAFDQSVMFRIERDAVPRELYWLDARGRPGADEADGAGVGARRDAEPGARAVDYALILMGLGALLLRRRSHAGHC